MTWQLRRATAADLDRLMAIEHEVFGADAWSRESMAAELADANGYYLVAFPVGDAEQIEAYAGLRAPRRAPQADIQTIAIVASARRKGLGRVIMGRLIDEARQRGAREIFLEVRADNPAARGLYESFGFESIAIRPRYYQPDDVDAVVMRLVIPEPRVELV